MAPIQSYIRRYAAPGIVAEKSGSAEKRNIAAVTNWASRLTL